MRRASWELGLKLQFAPMGQQVGSQLTAGGSKAELRGHTGKGERNFHVLGGGTEAVTVAGAARDRPRAWSGRWRGRPQIDRISPKKTSPARRVA